MYKFWFKRLLDVLISSGVLIILLPVYIFIAVVLLFINKGSVFFTQKRIGMNNREFKLLKFKSMTDKKDVTGLLLPDVKRLTVFGKFIRKTSLDELPQIFNVLQGKMSLVGPRPLLPEYLPFYNDYHIRRHEVRPGITGLAQINGRNNLTFGQRFDLDVEYVDNISIYLDFKLLYNTFLNLFKPKGDIRIGRPISEIDDVGITIGLSKNQRNEKRDQE